MWQKLSLCNPKKELNMIKICLNKFIIFFAILVNGTIVILAEDNANEEVIPQQVITEAIKNIDEAKKEFSDAANTLKTQLIDPLNLYEPKLEEGVNQLNDAVVQATKEL